MKLTKQLASSLLTQRWAIQRSALTDLCLQYASSLKAGDSLPDGDEDDGAPEAATPTILAGVQVIPIFGMLVKHVEGECVVNYDDIRNTIQAALGDTNTDAILLYVHSPGGWVLGLETFGAFIAEATKQKPIYVFVDGLCCSAAYWLSSQASAIYSTRDAVIGSVGVFSEYMNISNMLKDMGVDVHMFDSHPDKTAGNPDIPWDKSYDPRFKADTMALYNKFLAAVKSKRPNIPDDMLTGWDYSGEDALKGGMVDGLIDSIDEAVAFVSQKNSAVSPQ